MTLNVSPRVEVRLFDVARQEGIDPGDLMEKLISQYQPGMSRAGGTPRYTVANDPLMARLGARLAQAPADPGEVQEAEEDMNDLM